MRVVQMSPFSKQSHTPMHINPMLPDTALTARPPSNSSVLLDFKHFKKDDWILLGIIAMLILEGSTDYILLCALGYLFLMGL